MRRFLYVSNVGDSAGLGALEDLFSTVGDVKKSHVELIPESGHSREFGVLEMSTEQEAADCIERFSGTNVNGYHLVMVSERPKARPVHIAPPVKPKTRKKLR